MNSAGHLDGTSRRNPLRRRDRRVTKDSGDTFMVKPNRDSTGSDVNSNPIPRNQGSGVVDLEAPTPDHLHGKRMKGIPCGESVEKPLEIVRSHWRILACAWIFQHQPATLAERRDRR
jgi:hypothetical protein